MNASTIYGETYIGCDCDGTIYKGNCSIDFFLFCLRNNDGMKGFLLKHVGNYIKYLTGFRDFNYVTERFYQFMSHVEDIDRMVKEFWDKHINKIKDWFFNMDMKRVVVLTASASFLMEELQQRLGFAGFVATQVDKHTGKVDGANCIGDEKLKRFKKSMPHAELTEFYSDSRKDTPLASIADTAFKVKRNKIKPWEED